MRSRRHRLSDEGGRDGGRWGQKRETKRDEAPEASCYATADLLTYISKQKQQAAGYWSASPTQHRAKTHGLRNPCVQDTRRVVCVDHFAFLFEPDTKRLIIIIGRQIFGYTHTKAIKGTFVLPLLTAHTNTVTTAWLMLQS